jgi:hypothetical protein
MLCIFRLLRSYLKLRRYLFRDGLPHWARDLFGVLKYANVVGLVLPLAAITLNPIHFFRRLPQYIASKNSWFGSPVKFFTQGVTLMAGLSFFIGGVLLYLIPSEDRVADPTYTLSSVYWYVLLYALLAPVVIPLFSLSIAPFYFLLRFFSFNDKSVKEAWTEVKYVTIPTRPSVYHKIDRQRFLWSLCYYDVYFYLTAMIFLTPLTMVVFDTIIVVLVSTHSTTFKFAVVCVALSLYSGPLYIFVLRPYIALLLAVHAYPPRFLIAEAYDDLRTLLGLIAAVVRKDGWGLIDKDLHKFESTIAAYEIAARRKLKQTDLLSDKIRRIYLSERQEELSKVLNTGQLRRLHAKRGADGNEGFVRLLDRIDLISHSM